jgi:hypothetical protein
MALINADWWLYAIVAIGFAILMAINIYILVLWQHPDDKNEAFWPKTLVVRYRSFPCACLIVAL